MLGNVFLNGAEYAALGRTDAQFVSDVYVAFLNRVPDSGGLTYWTGQLSSGLPRNVVLNSFLFAPEFSAAMQAVFGTGASRSEVSTIVDLYGGLFRRLPDNSGFTYWQTQFRTAQCTGAFAVKNSVNSITQQFLGSTEYLARNPHQQRVRAGPVLLFPAPRRGFGRLQLLGHAAQRWHEPRVAAPAVPGEFRNAGTHHADCRGDVSALSS